MIPRGPRNARQAFGTAYRTAHQLLQPLRLDDIRLDDI
jgi:hypothetical protein